MLYQSYVFFFISIGADKKADLASPNGIAHFPMEKRSARDHPVKTVYKNYKTNAKIHEHDDCSEKMQTGRQYKTFNLLLSWTELYTARFYVCLQLIRFFFS